MLFVVSTIRLVNFFVSVDDALVGAAFEELALSVDDMDVSSVMVADSLDGVGQLTAFIIHLNLCAMLIRNWRGRSSENVLYTFQDIANPQGGLIFDSSGNLYGTTVGGGSGVGGTVFELTPSGGGWTYTDLHDFSGSDGRTPIGSVARDTSGNLYGTTFYGGAYGYGVVWEITP